LEGVDESLVIRGIDRAQVAHNRAVFDPGDNALGPQP
jgi:hypothetical protein